MSQIRNEQTLQDQILDLLRHDGWEIGHWKWKEGERQEYTQYLLENRLFAAIERNNKEVLKEIGGLSEDVKTQVLGELQNHTNTLQGMKGIYGSLQHLMVKVGETEGFLHIIDEDPKNNDYLAVEEFVIESDIGKRDRFDICLFINGIPLVILELKNPFDRGKKTEDEFPLWVTAFDQINAYQKEVPDIFKFLQVAIVSDGHVTKYFPLSFESKEYYQRLVEDSRPDVTMRGVWKDPSINPTLPYPHLEETVHGMLSPQNLTNLLLNFVFFRSNGGQDSKVLGRYSQFQAMNRIYNRYLEDKNRTGLIWHWQGSGKTFIMVAAAKKLLKLPDTPTVFVIVDRTEIEDQAYQTFSSAGVQVERISSIKELKQILEFGGKKRDGKRGVFICTIQKFRSKDFEQVAALQRRNIAIFTDESHRSQNGLLASQMRALFPNAAIFGFTGTPLDRDEEHNTFMTFGRPNERYLHRYTMKESIKDGFTVPFVHQSHLQNIWLDSKAYNDLLDDVTDDEEDLTDEEKRALRRRLQVKLTGMKSPSKIEAIATDIVNVYKEKLEVIEPDRKMIVFMPDRESAVLLKQALDIRISPELSEVVISYDPRNEDHVISGYCNQRGITDGKEFNAKIIQQIKSQRTPRIVIVKNMLLTGFDCPKLWLACIYTPLKEHQLLQALARINRSDKGKTEGVIIDYVGIVEPLNRAMQKYETDIVSTFSITGIKETEEQLCDTLEQARVLLGKFPTNTDEFNDALKSLMYSGKEEEIIAKAKIIEKSLKVLGSTSEVTKQRFHDCKTVLDLACWLSKQKHETNIDPFKIRRLVESIRERIQEVIDTGKIEISTELEVPKDLTVPTEKLQASDAWKEIYDLRVAMTRELQQGTLTYKTINEQVAEFVSDWQKRKEFNQEMVNRFIKLKDDIAKAHMMMLDPKFPLIDAFKTWKSSTIPCVKFAEDLYNDMRSLNLSSISFENPTMRLRIGGTVRDFLRRRGLPTSEEFDTLQTAIINSLEKIFSEKPVNVWSA